MGVHARDMVYAEAEGRALGERWRSGQCVADIARALERRNKSGVYRLLAVNGGIAPVPRRRAAVALRLAEREEISRGSAAGWSIRRIAQALRSSPLTISREIRRNGGCSSYRASRPIGAPGSGRCARSHVAWRAMQSYDGGRAEARAAVVAQADRWLAEVAIPCQQAAVAAFRAIPARYRAR